MCKQFKLEIKESAEHLKKLYKQEKRARIRERVQMLYLYKSGIATERQELSKILGRSKPTLTNWMKKYKAGGLKGILEMKASGHRPSVIPKEALREIKMRLDSEKGFESYKEVQMFLKQEWNLLIRQFILLLGIN